MLKLLSNVKICKLLSTEYINFSCDANTPPNFLPDTVKCT